MSDITKIDKNFASETVVYEGMKVYSVTESPFRVYGLYQPELGLFGRMPTDIAEKISDSIKQLHTNTAGGRIRFKTDSTRIVLRSVLPSLTKLNHMPLTGTSCFDLYVDGKYHGPFNPCVFKPSENDGTVVAEATRSFSGGKMQEILIHFPLYNDVKKLYIALDEQAKVIDTEGYIDDLPIVYYGSSITQGGCASHAGNAYQAIIARELNLDYLNLGFSGSCQGETQMAEYIAGLKMKAFIMDYDHNAPSVEHLEATHYPFYKCIREKNPQLPILIISAADLCFGADREKRQAVIRSTYERAIKESDKNVYYLNGQTIYQELGVDICTVDCVHPNDLGFWCMAKSIGEELKKILF